MLTTLLVFLRFFRDLVFGSLFNELSQLSPSEFQTLGSSTLLAASRLTRSMLSLMDCFSKVHFIQCRNRSDKSAMDCVQ